MSAAVDDNLYHYERERDREDREEQALERAVALAYGDPSALLEALWWCEPNHSPTVAQRLAHNALKAALSAAVHASTAAEAGNHLAAFMHSETFHSAMHKVVERRVERRGDDGCYDPEDYA